MSLDGYIADKDGGVSWLSGDGSDPENAGSYNSFIQTVDTVILGYKTYHQVTTELSPDVWPYADKMSYVITHNNLESKENLVFCDNLHELITTLLCNDQSQVVFQRYLERASNGIFRALATLLFAHQDESLHRSMVSALSPTV